MIYELAADFAEALKVMPQGHVKRNAVYLLQRSISLMQSSMQERPEFGSDMIWNVFRWLIDSDGASVKVSERGRQLFSMQRVWLAATAPIVRDEGHGALEVHFSMSAPLQSFAQQSMMLAVGRQTGEVEVWDLRRREKVATHLLPRAPVKGVALDVTGQQLAYVDSDDIVRTIFGVHSLPCRERERFIAFCSATELLVVDLKGDLVVWNAVTAECTVVSHIGSRSVITIRFSDQGRLVFIAGDLQDQLILVIDRTANSFACHPLCYAGVAATYADIDKRGENVVLACRDRCLRVLEVSSGNQLAELYYERHPSVHIVSAVCGCVFTKDGETDCVYFMTQQGSVYCWSWFLDRLEQVAQCWKPTQSVGVSLFDYLPESGRPFFTTDSRASSVTQTGRRADIPRHEAPVNTCFISDDGVVTSMSKQEQTVRWFNADGGDPCYKAQYVKSPSAMTRCGEFHTALMGNQAGETWKLPPTPPMPMDSFMQPLQEPVVSLLDREGEVVVAGESGTIRLISSDGSARTLWQGLGMSRQRRLCNADPHGVCWSLRSDDTDHGTRSVLSLIKERGREEQICSSFSEMNSLAVSKDGERVSIAGRVIEVFGHEGGEWKCICKCDKWVDHVAFVGDERYLAVTKVEHRCLEILHVAPGMPVVAATALISDATCLAVNDDRIAVGCASGDILCFQLTGVPAKKGLENEI